MQKRRDREYIDATEGGAYIQGTKLMTLKETIEKYCKGTVAPLHEKVSCVKLIGQIQRSD